MSNWLPKKKSQSQPFKLVSPHFYHDEAINEVCKSFLLRVWWWISGVEYSVWQWLRQYTRPFSYPHLTFWYVNQYRHVNKLQSVNSLPDKGDESIFPPATLCWNVNEWPGRMLSINLAPSFQECPLWSERRFTCCLAPETTIRIASNAWKIHWIAGMF